MRIAWILQIVAMWLCLAETGLRLACAADRLQESKTPTEATSADDGAALLLNTSLADLAKAQGLDPADFLSYRSVTNGGLFCHDRGEVDTVYVLDGRQALAVQTVPAHGNLGVSGQQVVLLSLKGRILDRIQCGINARYGSVKLEILPRPDPDGTRAVIRFSGARYYVTTDQTWVQECWHNRHTITFHGQYWTFLDDREKAGPHSEWNEKGLCRIGIADNRFVVLFPKLEIPDVGKAKSMTIVYCLEGVGRSTGTERRLEIADPKQVSELLAAITIKGQELRSLNMVPATWNIGPDTCTTVEFKMPDGTETTWKFHTPDHLSYIEERRKTPISGAGSIELTSRAFFDAVSKAVAKAEGRPIELVRESKDNR
jgi:hypothetical protein